MTPTFKGLGFGPLAALLLSACAAEAVGPTTPVTPPQPGHAYLKIVGDANVFLENSASKQLVVKYVNDNDEPLAGTVTFSMNGTAAGGAVSAASGVTGADGSVHINVTGGATGEAYFKVTANAQYATPVDWSVSVKPGTTPPIPGPLNVIGTYQLESTFDLATGLPGTVGDVVRAIIDMTDGPTDPATWVLDTAVAGDASAKSTLSTFRPALDAFLNSLLSQIPPICIDGTCIQVIDKFKEFGNAFGDVSKKFGIKSTLQVYAGPNNTLLGKHTITGVFFKIDNKVITKTLGELNMDNIVVDKIPLTLTGETKLNIGDHNIALSYGKIVVFALDNVVIPAIDPMATNLRELLADIVDCDSVGDSIADYVGFGSGSLWGSLCETGLAFGASFAEGKLATVGDTATEFKIHGDVRPVDTNNDRKVDSLVGGLWEGQLLFGGNPATLAKPAQVFAGTRMGN